MSQRNEKCIARIYAQNRTIVGGGILIAENCILTCAHVAAFALGLSSRPDARPTGRITIDFPIYQKSPGKYLAGIAFWGGTRHDIAILELTQKNHCPPERLCLLKRYDKLPYMVLGFPAGTPAGRWSRGEMIGKDARGYVQIESTMVPGQRIEQGFSGAPVYSDNSVVGIIAETVRDPQMKTAYMIPTETLLEIWPAMKDYVIASAGGRLQTEQAEIFEIVEVRKPGKSTTPPVPPQQALEVSDFSDVAQKWLPGRPVRDKDITYILSDTVTEVPEDEQYRTLVWRQAHARLASSSNPQHTGNTDYWLKQVAFRRQLVPQEQQRRAVGQLREESELLRDLNDAHEKYFPRFISFNDKSADHATLVFTAHSGVTLAKMYGFVRQPNDQSLHGKPLTIQSVRQVLEGIPTLCTMLAALHQRKYAHRNLSPETILYTSVQQKPQLLLRDLGLATRPKEREGQIDYAAPEQRKAIDAFNIGPATDIYQLGAVLYHLFCGESPYHAVWSIREPSALNMDLPEALDAVIMRALEDDYGHRWERIEDFGAALLNVVPMLK